MLSYKLSNKYTITHDEIKYDNFIKRRVIGHIINPKKIYVSNHIIRKLNDIPPELLSYDVKQKIMNKMKYCKSRNKDITHELLTDCLNELCCSNVILDYIM